ncbi:MAG TPA: hypothetical protein VNN07_00145, partial [Candidatus Tectomicrobia bacterium]|nr:hypothetical protein [Candidatus Tectomicrobia bacterium]
MQLRSLVPAPPLKARAVARYVGLEAPRLFRRNGKALVTAGRLVPVAPHQHALWAAAAEEPLLRAVLSGCAQAGIEVDDIGPASEVLPRALSGSSGARTIAFSSEVIEVGPGGAWRSRLVRGQEGAGSGERFVPEVETLGPGAGYAAAYAA